MEQTNQQPTVQAYKIREAFNMPDVPESAQLPGYAPGLHGVPKLDPTYVFEVERLRQLTMFWVAGFTALMIEGDPSAGKTSLVSQWHARLNVPLYKVACTDSTEMYQLIGQLLPQADGSLKWVDGPVTKACRENASVLLDEFNNLNPNVATGLNMILEAESWCIPETGEIVAPGKNTRFFITQNSIDSKLLVSGRSQQDAANEDRFCYMEVDYLKPELEKAAVVDFLVAGRVPEDVSKNIAGICVDVANKVRAAFRGDADAITKPLSTRVIKRWAKYTVMYQSVMKAQGKSGLHYAIRQSVKMPSDMAGAVNEIITMVAGFDENLRHAA